MEMLSQKSENLSSVLIESNTTHIAALSTGLQACFEVPVTRILSFYRVNGLNTDSFGSSNQ